MNRRQVTIPTDDGLCMWATEYIPPEGSDHDIIIVLPGLKGYAAWGGFPWICWRLCKNGMKVICVDFSRNGVVDFGTEITRLDLAERNSPTRQVIECGLLLNELRTRKDPPRNTFLLGHSLGGAIALLCAPTHSDITGVITWSAVSRLDRWSPAVIEQWEKDGKINIRNSRTGDDFFLGSEYLRDVKEIGAHGILESVENITCPLLILHGDQDESVPIHHAHDIFMAVVNSMAELHVLHNANHTFGAVHPFKGPTAELELAVHKTIDWLDYVSHPVQEDG